MTGTVKRAAAPCSRITAALAIYSAARVARVLHLDATELRLAESSR